ncbi:MAG: diaminopimelate epimerase [Nitrospirae bacterium]|nr:diaminopimelate epimerase [Nitrospirota bacterium]
MHLSPGHFVKFHALGNDYLVFDEGDLTFPLVPEAVRRICDRRRGVGSDGILLVVSSEKADFGLRIFNPDGSEAEKSGNGLRIAAKYLYQHSRTNKESFAIETRGGIVQAHLKIIDWVVVNVSVEMGRAEVGPAERLDAGTDVVPVNIGNPHAVVFVNDPNSVDVPVVGRRIETDARFAPGGVNVEFVSVLGRGALSVRVWERGAGETPASGTGASAAAAAAAAAGKVDRGVIVKMPGGELMVAVGPDFSVTLAGPVEEVMIGDLSAELVSGLRGLSPSGNSG